MLDTRVDPNSVDPHSTIPGAVIGHRADGRPIRLMAGGAPDDDSGDSEEEGDADDENDGSDDNSDSADSEDEEEGEDPAAEAARLKAENKTLRREAAQRRVQLQQARAALKGKTTGKSKDTSKNDSEDEDDDEADHPAAALAFENAVLRLAPSLGVNADRLLDSRSFTTALAEIGDPTDREAIKTAIKAALTADPTLRTKPQVGKSSAGKAGGGQKKTPAKGLEAAINAHYAQQS